MLQLPDTDDVMRLQQVRDWLAGQRFSDLTQHRLGAGVPMHWSRLGDLGPALLIVAFRSLGSHVAELVAVIVWPLLLFAVALSLVARTARAIGASAGTATVVAALAYPATTIFLPGRIDHHGLQLVLLLIAIGRLLARDGDGALLSGGMRSGAVIGVAATASLVVGLETTPLLVTIGGLVTLDWVAARMGSADRLMGLGAGALMALAVARLTLAPDAFAFAACDGFTADSWAAAMAGAVGALLLGSIGRALTLSRGARIAFAAAAGAALSLAVVRVAPRCLTPYGAVDPELARWWLARVGEAQPLLHAAPATAIGYAGIMAAGLVATAWWLLRERSRGWAMLLALQLVAMATTMAQLRGAYVGAVLGAPALAMTIAAARRHGVLPLAIAWGMSAGMVYPIAAEAFMPSERSAAAGTACTAPIVVQRLADLPPGTLMAPIDVGAWAIAATSQRPVAGPYHRNTAGNRAMLGFFRADPDRAARIAGTWRVRYVLLCDADGAAFAASPNAIASRIVAGRPPLWLQPLAAPGIGVHLFIVRHVAH